MPSFAHILVTSNRWWCLWYWKQIMSSNYRRLTGWTRRDIRGPVETATSTALQHQFSSRLGDTAGAESPVRQWRRGIWGSGVWSEECAPPRGKAQRDGVRVGVALFMCSVGECFLVRVTGNISLHQYQYTEATQHRAMSTHNTQHGLGPTHNR